MIVSEPGYVTRLRSLLALEEEFAKTVSVQTSRTSERSLPRPATAEQAAERRRSANTGQKLTTDNSHVAGSYTHVLQGMNDYRLLDGKPVDYRMDASHDPRCNIGIHASHSVRDQFHKICARYPDLPQWAVLRMLCDLYERQLRAATTEV